VQNRHTFDTHLRELRAKLMKMGGSMQTAMRDAVASLKTLDSAKAQQIVEGDKEINALQHEIEDMCIRLIATQQPVASDLRKIVAGMQIAIDLERMADLAVDIAKSTIRLQGQTLMKPLIDIPKMAEILDKMISDALLAYVQSDVSLAAELAKTDDEVDHLYRQIVEELFNITHQNPGSTSQAMTLSFVGRYLERIGDHATNIGESTIFIVTGERSDLN
jgi:phosphate transport system protein